MHHNLHGTCRILTQIPGFGIRQLNCGCKKSDNFNIGAPWLSDAPSCNIHTIKDVYLDSSFERAWGFPTPPNTSLSCSYSIVAKVPPQCTWISKYFPSILKICIRKMARTQLKVPPPTMTKRPVGYMNCLNCREDPKGRHGGIPKY